MGFIVDARGCGENIRSQVLRGGQAQYKAYLFNLSIANRDRDRGRGRGRGRGRLRHDPVRAQPGEQLRRGDL